MSKSLVLLVNRSAELETLLIESGGEITPEIEMALSVQDVEIAEKIDGYAFILERLDHMQDYYKAKSDFYRKMATQCENANKRLKDNINFAMQSLGTNELMGGEIRFVKKPTTGKLIIKDEELIPVEYKKEVVTTEVDKKALKEDLKTKEIPGAEIEPGVSIQVYANTSRVNKKAVVNG